MAPQKRRTTRKLLDSKLLQKFTISIDAQADVQDVKVALIGGAAMNFYGSPRMTWDLDFVAQKLFKLDGFDPVKTLTFGGARYMTGSGIPVDLVVREDEYADLYKEALAKAQPTEEGYFIVDPNYLAVMKFATRRAKDHLDLMWLILQRDLLDLPVVEKIVKQYLGGRFAVDEFRQVVAEAEWRKGEFDEKGTE